VGVERKAGTLKTGERITAAVADVAFGGDGVARHGRFVVFIPFTADGDVVEAEIVAVRQRYARARLVRVITPSAHRVAASCRFYTVCGGCRMQHLAYDHQLALKRRQVAEALNRIAGLPQPTVESVIASPRPLGYRGKAEFHVTGGPEPRTGLMAMASHRLVEIDGCALLDASVNRKYGLFRRLIAIGQLASEGKRQVIWSDQPGAPPADAAAELRGQPEIERVVSGKRLMVPYQGFFQANLSLLEALVGEVARNCALSGRETVIDAYGGVGLFSLFLGGGAGRIVLIEGDAATVRCARLNMDRQGLTQAEVLGGDVADVLGESFVARQDRADVVVLDPPRDGCGEGVIGRVASLGPQRVVYVSCNPATLARDVARFHSHGYRLYRLQPFDMFPQTAHIEAVALLTC
jgi:23S rRNA (uracil1939-C5)-methyltransferase